MFGKLFGFGKKKNEDEIKHEEVLQEETAKADSVDSDENEDDFDTLSDFEGEEMVEEPQTEDISLVDSVLLDLEDREEKDPESAKQELEITGEQMEDMVWDDDGKLEIIPTEQDNQTDQEYVSSDIEETDIILQENFENDAAEQAEISEETQSDEADKTKGFFAKLKEGLTKTRDNISRNIDNVLKSFTAIDEDMYEALEEALIMADIGTETSLYIIEQLRIKVKQEKITETEGLRRGIRDIITEIMQYENSALRLTTKPSIIMVIGVNGVGKTTTIGKIASALKKQGKTVMLAAGDSFRAGAIEQLQVWADRVDVPLVKHQEGADPGAVIFDAIASAKAKNADVVICDTAGRLHNKQNLMNELSKIFRIIDRELPEADKEVLLVLDATTGQNAVVQAKTFGEVASLTGIVLTKLDGTAKGGIVIAISKEQNIPVKLIGVGEGIDDLQKFDPKEFAMALFPDNEEQ